MTLSSAGSRSEKGSAPRWLTNRSLVEHEDVLYVSPPSVAAKVGYSLLSEGPAKVILQPDIQLLVHLARDLRVIQYCAAQDPVADDDNHPITDYTNHLLQRKEIIRIERDRVSFKDRAYTAYSSGSFRQVIRMWEF